MYLDSTNCCGIDELVGMDETPKELLRYAYEKIFDEDDCDEQAFIFFSDVKGRVGGKNLCAYIKREKLGKVISTGWKTNPNTDNKIKMWVWSVNYRALKAWYRNK